MIHFDATIKAQEFLRIGNAEAALHLTDVAKSLYPETTSLHVLHIKAAHKVLGISRAKELLAVARIRFPFSHVLEDIESSFRIGIESASEERKEVGKSTDFENPSHVDFERDVDEKADVESLERGAYLATEDKEIGESEPIAQKATSAVELSLLNQSVSDAVDQLAEIATLRLERFEQYYSSPTSDDVVVHFGESTAKLEPRDQPPVADAISSANTSYVQLDEEVASTEQTSISEAESESDNRNAFRQSGNNWRMVETPRSETDQRRFLRSSNLRLIPGLEFAPLRFESSTQRTVRFNSLPEPPAFRDFESESEQELEQLEATHLTRDVGVPRNQKDATKKQYSSDISRDPDTEQFDFVNGEYSPPIVNDTLALIYEQQGAIEVAIQAYTLLLKNYPEKSAHYLKKIETLKTNLGR